MSFKIRYCNLKDLDKIYKLEKEFFKNEAAPPDSKETIKYILKFGRILAYEESFKIKGCIEIVPITKLRIISPPIGSLLEKVVKLDLEKYLSSNDAILIHRWIGNRTSSNILYNRLLDDYKAQEWIGFVDPNNKKALDFYLSLENVKTIDQIPKLYTKNDVHYVLKRFPK